MSVPRADSFDSLAAQLVEVGRLFYSRGWVLGTSGNFSAVVTAHPFRLAITTSGVDKGLLEPADVVAIDDAGRVVQGNGRPSAEATLHLAIVRARGAGAVLHTHSIWSTILSDNGSTLALDGYEMLKGLDGVRTHEHREELPIIENTQDWAAAVPQVESLLKARPTGGAHGFLIRRHGLYTLGRDLAAARRHVEILEFLFETMGRKRGGGTAWQP